MSRLAALLLYGLACFGPLLLFAAEEKAADGEHTIYLRDFGGHDVAFLRLPDEAPEAGLVLLPGRNGVDAAMKDVCRMLAKKKLITLAIDLYAGRPAKTEEEWAFLQTSLDAREVVSSVASGCRFFQQSPRFHAGSIILAGTGQQAAALLSVAPEDQTVAGVVLLDPEFSPEFKWPEKAVPPVLMVRTVRKEDSDVAWAAISGARDFQTVEVKKPLLSDPDEKAWLPVTAFFGSCSRPEPKGLPLWKKVFGE